MPKRKVRRAVITAAGLGTRFLPATKNLPKEMLPIVDTPIIHYVAAECVEAGIEEIILVIRPGNEAVMNYFTPSKQLEKMLKEAGKEKQLEKYYEVAERANFVFVHQKSGLPYGNGSPILTVKSLVEDEPFVVCWGDDLVLNSDGVGGVKQVVDSFVSHEDAYGVLATTVVPHEEIVRYGMVELENGGTEGRIKRIVEKPKLEDATSDLAEFGRMVLSPEIFKYLVETNTGKDGELWLMDSIEKLLVKKPVYAKTIQGEFLTTGDPLRFLKTSFKFAMQRPELAEDLKEFLRKEIIE
ncbi:MAG TPA: UTP--glucose-1-phosphate uridylyltransferase [Patescibacteria group bacterium]